MYYAPSGLCHICIYLLHRASLCADILSRFQRLIMYDVCLDYINPLLRLSCLKGRNISAGAKPAKKMYFALSELLLCFVLYTQGFALC